MELVERNEREKSPADELIKKNITKIRGMFGKLVTQTSIKLHQQAKVSVKDFRLFFITSFFPALKDKKSISKVAVLVDLKKATNFSTLLQVLTTHGVWSYENYYFLESVIEMYVPDLRKDMEGYLEHLEGFRLTTKLEQYIAARKCFQIQKALTPKSSLVWRLDFK